MELDFYSGYEGEPEIVITRFLGDAPMAKLRMWAGYFDQIVSLIPPGATGWRGFTEHYHLHSGWYENDRWFDPDVRDTLALLDESRAGLPDSGPVREVWAEYADLLRDALRTDGRVSIEYF